MKNSVTKRPATVSLATKRPASKNLATNLATKTPAIGRSGPR